MKIGDLISIKNASAWNSNANHLLSAACHCNVVEVTEKAVKVVGLTENEKQVSAWFPKKALVSWAEKGNLDGHDMHFVKLAPWFKPNEWTNKFLGMTNRIFVLAPQNA